MSPASPRIAPRRLVLLLLAVLATVWYLAHQRPALAPAGPQPASVEFRVAPPPAGAVAPDARDLAADEAAGGHTLARHIGRSDAELEARLAAEPNLAAASTFTDRAAAERAVAGALAGQASRVEAWRARARGGNLALAWPGDGGVVGRVLERGARQSRPAVAARVVLRRRGDGFFVLTAYPEIER